MVIYLYLVGLSSTFILLDVSPTTILTNEVGAGQQVLEPHGERLDHVVQLLT